jgi:branched-chain amino acid transport system substrate-binding protein
MSLVGGTRRWVLCLVAFVLGTAILPVVAFSSAAGAASTIKVGLLADNTGVYSAVFAGVTQGMEAELNQVNAKGGVNGHHISYSVYDTQSSPTQAVAVSKEAVDQGNFALLVGSQFSSYALPYLRSQNIPMVGWAVSPGWNGPDMFGFGGSTESKSGQPIYTTDLLAFIKKEGYKKIAILADSSAGSSSAGVAEAPAAKKLGLDVVYSNTAVPEYGADLAQVQPVVQKAQQAGAQFILSFMGVDGPLIQANAQLANPMKVMILTGYGPGLPQQLGSDFNGVYVQANAAAYESQKGPGITDFLNAMKAFGVTGTPMYYNELGYVIATMFVWGLQRAGKTPTQASLVKALNTLNNQTFGGLIPPVSYPADRYSETPCGVITQYKNGKYVVVGQQPWTCGKDITGS